MTLDEFLTLSLPQRIKWLHGPQGPQGVLSHDKFAKILGTTRQTIIGWEKRGIEPVSYVDKLAEFSGFPAAAFRRRGAETLASDLQEDSVAQLTTRLEALEALVAHVAGRTALGFEALGHLQHGLDAQKDQEPRG